MLPTIQLILCTCPDNSTAKAIATHLVVDGLAACVNIVPNLMSVYSWQGQIETNEECLLLIKAPKNHYSAIETKICNLHPYDLPEIIAIPVHQGLADYLHWINSCPSTK